MDLLVAPGGKKKLGSLRAALAREDALAGKF